MQVTHKVNFSRIGTLVKQPDALHSGFTDAEALKYSSVFSSAELSTWEKPEIPMTSCV